jgi:mannose-6-phosphate isomerase
VERILGCFEKIPVEKGDVFLVPGGFPHAIGEGIFMIEVMEPTDFVVRIEFERQGYILPEEARFMGRDVDFALSMFDFRRTTVDEVREWYFGRPRIINHFNSESSEVSLIDERMTSCFSVSQLNVKGAIERKEAGFYIAIVTEGCGLVESSDGKPRSVGFGDRFLVTAEAGNVHYFSKKGMQLTLALPPK